MPKVAVIPLIPITANMYKHIANLSDHSFCFLNGRTDSCGLKYCSIRWILKSTDYDKITKQIVHLTRGCSDLAIHMNRSTIRKYCQILPRLKKKAPKLTIRVFYSDASIGWKSSFIADLKTIGKHAKILLVSDKLAVDAVVNATYCYPPGLTTYFKPINTNKIYDVNFVGQSYNKPSADFLQERIQWLKYIIPKLPGVKIALLGSKDWAKIGGIFLGNNSGDKSIAKFTQCNKIFNQSKITLCHDIGKLPMATSIRTANAMLSGSFVLIKYKPGFEKMFKNGEHLVWFKTNDECIKLIKHYLIHDKEREKIAQQGRLFALNHGYTDVGLVKRLMEQQ